MKESLGKNSEAGVATEETSADLEAFYREIEELKKSDSHFHLTKVNPQELTLAEYDLWYHFQELRTTGFNRELVARYEKKLKRVSNSLESNSSRENFLEYLLNKLIPEANKAWKEKEAA
jgi:hypothetical protein